jgi:hypothetical protein
MPVPLNKPVPDQKIKRDDPKLFGAEELKIAAGYGTFALKGDGNAPLAAGAPAAPKAVNAPPKPAARGGGFDALGLGAAKMGAALPNPSRPAAGGGGIAQSGHGFKPGASCKLQPQAWVVVTGLIPIEKQRQEYARVFDRALDENRERDTPHYWAAKVQRTEVSDSDPNKVDWKPIEDPDKFEEQWENKINEIIDPAYIDPNLTADLGPLVGTDWGEAVAHPKIPLASAQSREAQAQLVQTETKPPEPEAAKPAAAEGLVGHRARAVAPPPPAAATLPGQAAKAPPPIAYRLLRIFDYSVEPNKRYRYRIQLALNNPNHKVADRHLKNPGAPRPELRFTDEWVETPVVAVPSGIGVLAGGPPSGFKPKNSADPAKVKIMLTAIEKESGVEATVVKELERGAVANSKEEKLKAHDPRTGSVMDLSDVSFATDTLVLDMYGGRKLSNKRDSSLASPIEVLLLDKNGRLSVRSELDDHQQFELLKPPEDAEPASESKKSSEPKKAPRGFDDFKKKVNRK